MRRTSISERSRRQERTHLSSAFIALRTRIPTRRSRRPHRICLRTDIDLPGNTSRSARDSGPTIRYVSGHLIRACGVRWHPDRRNRESASSRRVCRPVPSRTPVRVSHPCSPRSARPQRGGIVEPKGPGFVGSTLELNLQSRRMFWRPRRNEFGRETRRQSIGNRVVFDGERPPWRDIEDATETPPVAVVASVVRTAHRCIRHVRRYSIKSF